MKLQGKSTNAVIVAMLAIVALGIGFWVWGVSPKREEAAKLDKRVANLESSLALSEEEVQRGEEARRDFPADYQKLVVLGKAVPGDDDTASLLVQINRIAEQTNLEFLDVELSSEGGEAEEATATEGATPTEAEASLLPLGATVGPAGLAVMPYKFTLHGKFFTIADFIEDVDALVRTRNEDVVVDGRLFTLDGFSLEPDPEKGFPYLEVEFVVTTYLTPPGQGVTGGATAASPETAEATPASATIGATP